jgi:hypothetical protein
VITLLADKQAREKDERELGEEGSRRKKELREGLLAFQMITSIKTLNSIE